MCNHLYKVIKQEGQEEWGYCQTCNARIFQRNTREQVTGLNLGHYSKRLALERGDIFYDLFNAQSSLPGIQRKPIPPLD